jgi:transcription initiation factor TFIID subunit 2
LFELSLNLSFAMLGKNEARTDEELDHFDMERVLEAQAEEQLDKALIAPGI